MAKPNLALIPAAIGTKLYSVLPSDGSGDFTFTRGSAATRINAQGLIETVSNTSSRLNYPLLDGKVVGCPHNLLEPQSTNLVTYSELFTGWTLDDATIVGNNAISPDGTLNAVLLKGNTNSSRHHIQKGGWSQNANSSLSVFVKAKELKYVQIATANDVNQYANFDVSVGVVGTVGSSFSNAKIEDYGNGWYRLSVVGTRSNGLYISLVSGLTASWLESWTMANNTDGLFIWGGQAEISSFATSYIPTTNQVTTRLGETATGSGNSTTFSDSEGVLMAEISRQEGNVLTTAWSVNNGALANSVNVYYYGTNVLYFDIFSGSATVSGNININTYNLNKIALKYKSGSISLYVNGFELITKTNAISLSGLKDLDFNFGAGNQPFHGKTKQVQYFDSILDSQQLEELTSWQSFSDMAEGQLYTIE